MAWMLRTRGFGGLVIMEKQMEQKEHGKSNETNPEP